MTSRLYLTFQRTVWKYYEQNGRHDLPWRQTGAGGSFDPYRIVVSEIMLQQTQVTRVVPKYTAFIDTFPSFERLAEAPLERVLRIWSGLGYNRRAKYLHELAKSVVLHHGGRLPADKRTLTGLPGIGPNTAGAILAYAYNQPEVFIETNIRTVFIHHFFPDRRGVSDKELLPLVADTVAGNPREWYWALMDYGTYLKQTVGNVSRASSAYSKQSAFHGSRRQIRGLVLRLLTEGSQPLSNLERRIADGRVADVVADLEREGFIEREGSGYRLKR